LLDWARETSGGGEQRAVAQGAGEGR